MEKTIKRIVKTLFPELTAGYHLPRFAEVVAVRQTPAGGEVCDEFKPIYAADIQILDEYGYPDMAFPVLKDVHLPIPVAGNEMGIYAYPEDGTWVEVGFAYGSPNRPFIRCILPHGRSLIPCERGEMRWQHNPMSYQNVDKSGNWETFTDGNLTDTSLKKTSTATVREENYTTCTKTVTTNDTEKIGGFKTIIASMGIQLISGQRWDFGSLLDFNIVSALKFRTMAPKTWCGSNDENIFILLSELMQIVINMNNLLAAHTHQGAGCDQASTFSTYSGDTSAVKARQDGITETQTPPV